MSRDSYDFRRKAEAARGKFRGSVMAVLASILAIGGVPTKAPVVPGNTGPAAVSNKSSDNRAVPVQNAPKPVDSGALRALMEGAGAAPIWRRRILHWTELVFLRTRKNAGATGKCGKSKYSPRVNTPKYLRQTAKAA